MTREDFGRIGILAGGPSRERDISLRSGSAVHKALQEEGLDAVLFDVRDDVYGIIRDNKIDVAFIALHGRFGEDGTVQKILEEAGIPYTGSNPDASQIALDKIASKAIFQKRGIKTPRYMVFEKNSFKREDAVFVGFPMVVKPQLEGSSIGLSVVREEGSLNKAAEKAFACGDSIILEEYIKGREITVGILDDEPLPVIEIIPKNRIYDYEAKYMDPETQYIVPAPIEKGSYEKAQRLGALSHTALGCKSFSRVDMIMDEDGEIFVLEVNTIPGMTERSLLPKAALSRGISFGKMCIKIIEGALQYEKAKKA